MAKISAIKNLGIEPRITEQIIQTKIFGRDEALRALKGAEEILKLCRRLIKEEQKE